MLAAWIRSSLRAHLPAVVALGLVGSGAAIGCLVPEEYLSGIVWPEPPVVTPGQNNSPPSDAIVLFDGTNLDQWEGGDQWLIQDGYAVVQGTGITSKQSFGDCQLHLEFATPETVEGSGQGRGNSGVYLMGRYEIQILDSYDNPTYFDGQCGAIYKQQPPMVNASRPPGEWQTYDIVFEAPKFAEDGTLESPAYVTVFQNGVLLHHHQALAGSTAWDAPPTYTPHPSRLPIHLQNHGNPMRFRNIWLRENVQPLVGTLPKTEP